MFKKKPTIKPLAPIRSSDRRKLADQIIKDFDLEPTTIDNDQSAEQKAEATVTRTSLRNNLLPENTQSARFTTTQGPDLKQASGTVYVGSHHGDEGRILWFQVEGRMYPSMYTLWQNPDIVPLLHTHEPVVEKLKGGADLMTPGLAGGPPFPERAQKGEIVAIASTARPSVPVAMGWCEIDVSALNSVQGTKGHAVKNMHWLGDEAWAFGATGKAGQAAPEEIGGRTRAKDDEELLGGVEGLNIEDEHEQGGVSLDSVALQGDAAGNKTNGYNTHVEGVDVPSIQQDDEQEMSQAEIDDAFRNAFLYGIHKHKPSNTGAGSSQLVFPLHQSFIVSNLIQPFLPTFTPRQEKQLQIKNTSWKNIKKFVKTMDKQQIVKSKEQNKNETVILDIDFDDPAVTSFKPYGLPKKETSAGTSLGRGETANEQIDTGDESIGQKLKVATFFKPTTKLQPVFGSATKQLLIPSEVREIITTYIESENLVQENNKRLVKLDPTLGNAVFDGSGALDKEVLAKGSVPRDALIDRVLHAMSPSYVIVRNGNDDDSAGSTINSSNSSRARSGTPPKIHITLETRSGNKTVTKVSGLEVYFITPKLLADELRKVCAGSTSVELVAGAAKKNEKPVEAVTVQGPQKDAVIKALERRGVDRRWVEVADKTKKGKR